MFVPEAGRTCPPPLQEKGVPQPWIAPPPCHVPVPAYKLDLNVQIDIAQRQVYCFHYKTKQYQARGIVFYIRCSCPFFSQNFCHFHSESEVFFCSSY